MWMRVSLLILLLAPGVALAGKPAPKPVETLPPDPAPAATATPAAASPGMEGRKPTDVLRFEALVIEGRVQKPQALELLRRSTISFADLVPDESLLPKIYEAVESEPF